jgi:hypothetical protein
MPNKPMYMPERGQMLGYGRPNKAGRPSYNQPALILGPLNHQLFAPGLRRRCQSKVRLEPVLTCTGYEISFRLSTADAS